MVCAFYTVYSVENDGPLLVPIRSCTHHQAEGVQEAFPGTDA